MNQKFKIIFLGFFVIGTFDAISSIASKHINFDYTYLGIVSILIYGYFGYLGTKESSLKNGVMTGAVMGLFDSTVGWAISFYLNARVNLQGVPTLISFLATVVFVIALGALCGLIGGSLARKRA